MFVVFMVCPEDTNYVKRSVPGSEKMPSSCPGELSFLGSRVKLHLSFDYASNTLNTHVKGAE